MQINNLYLTSVTRCLFANIDTELLPHCKLCLTLALRFLPCLRLTSLS